MKSRLLELLGLVLIYLIASCSRALEFTEGPPDENQWLWMDLMENATEGYDLGGSF